MKTIERERARALRRERGMSVREIAVTIRVSRSSASTWVRDIELTDRQRSALERRNPIYNRQSRGADKNAARGLTRRRAYQEEGRALARRGDPLHAAGCMLYWGEGDKHRNLASLSNSDPEVVRFFVMFLEKYFDVRGEQIRVRCTLHADHEERQREVEDYWLAMLELPPECLTKSIVNVYPRSSQRKRMNMLPYGTCRVSVHSTRVVQSIYGSIQEYAGFERPEWLN